MPDASQQEQFIRLLTEHQNRIYAYIYSLLGDHSRAADVLQETNLVLWRKSAELGADAAFVPWAFASARFQVLAHLRDKSRERILLDAELVELVEDAVAREASRMDDRHEALRFCLKKLAPRGRELIQLHYFQTRSIKEMSEVLHQSVSAIKVALLRTRRGLQECVRRWLAAEEV